MPTARLMTPEMIARIETQFHVPDAFGDVFVA